LVKLGRRLNKYQTNDVTRCRSLGRKHVRGFAIIAHVFAPHIWKLCVKGKGMTKEDVKRGSTFTSYMASASAAALAYLTMKYLNLAGSPDETGSLLFYGLLYAFIFIAFRFFTSRFLKWLYS
jgi:hypothetical protein